MSLPPLSYAFQPREKIRRGVVRVLGEIAVRGQGLAGRSREPMGELMHEGRLLIKRVRALLWFARPALGMAAYSQARTRLREAAGLLADQRDLEVAQATLEELAQETSKTRDRAAVGQIFQDLVRHSAAGEASEEAMRQLLQNAMAILHQSVGEVKRNTPGRVAWPSPSARVAEAFHEMRRTGKKARRTGKDVDFHTWRKKAKSLLYQLELTQAGPERRRTRVMKRVAKLQDALGAYHDGVVVEDRLRQMTPFSSSAQRVLRLLEKRKAHLRKKTWKLARRVEAAI